MKQQSKDPLHGVTLQMIVEQLVAFYGFDTLGELVKIKCFTTNFLYQCFKFKKFFGPW